MVKKRKGTTGLRSLGGGTDLQEDARRTKESVGQKNGRHEIVAAEMMGGLLAGWW